MFHVDRPLWRVPVENVSLKGGMGILGLSGLAWHGLLDVLWRTRVASAREARCAY